MQSQDKIKQHATLVDHMATTLGLDLEEKTMQGLLEPEAVTDAVLRCTGCTSPNECAQWMTENQAPQETAPDYCRNQHLFAELKGPQAD
ncbi:MAG: DUF6455 family protein [Thalassovita sp.]